MTVPITDYVSPVGRVYPLYESRCYCGRMFYARRRTVRACSALCRNSHRMTAPAATDHPTTIDIAWAAGLYEGEGSCHPKGRVALTASVAQKDTYVLRRLIALFGGAISTSKGMSSWQVSGARARGFLYTVFTFLSPRRRVQVRRALRREVVT